MRLPTSWSLSLAAAAALCAPLAGCDKAPAGVPAGAQAASASGTPAASAPGPAAAPAPAAAALAGTRYGAGVTLAAEQAVSIDELLANPTAYDGRTVRVEGMVTDVCPKRGCWMELAGTGAGSKVRFKVDDGVMTFPMEAKGAVAVAQGTVAVKTMTLEETRSYAEYQAKEYGKPYDPAAITEPMVMVRIDGTGAVIRDGE